MTSIDDATMTDKEERAVEDTEMENLNDATNPPHVTEPPGPSKGVLFSGEDGNLQDNPTTLSTKANKTYSDYVKQLMPQNQSKAKTPFKGLSAFTEENDDDDYYHFFANKNSRITYAVVHKQELSKVDAVKARNPGPTIMEWMKCANIIFNGKDSDDYICELLSAEDIESYKTSMVRLAFTPANKMFTVKRGSVIDANESSRAWYTAKEFLGSWYNHKEPTPKKKQAKVTDTFKRPGNPHSPKTPPAKKANGDSKTPQTNSTQKSTPPRRPIPQDTQIPRANQQDSSPV
jgi:hypothetical protein